MTHIRCMSEFVSDIVNRQLSDLVINGKTYEQVPESLRPLSGSIAMAFGYKIRNGKGYVPKGKLKSLIALDKNITEDLSRA